MSDSMSLTGDCGNLRHFHDTRKVPVHPFSDDGSAAGTSLPSFLVLCTIGRVRRRSEYGYARLSSFEGGTHGRRLRSVDRTARDSSAGDGRLARSPARAVALGDEGFG